MREIVFVKQINMKQPKEMRAVRLEKDQIKLIENLADKMEISFSQATRMIIDKYFKRKINYLN